MMNNFRNFIGKQFVTNEGYTVEIIDYIDRHNVLIKFIGRPELQIWSTMQNIKLGQIKNPYHKSIFGIGYYGVGNYTARINNEKTEEYVKWFSMFNRCYNDSFQAVQPTYIGCTVSEEFCNFQNFASWYNRNKYECSYSLELDKDLLYEGNKVYSHSTCCLLPKELNSNLNINRNNPQQMKHLYDKYKNELPYRLRMEIFNLTKNARESI